MGKLVKLFDFMRLLNWWIRNLMGVCEETSSVLAVDQTFKDKLSYTYAYWTSSPCSTETKFVSFVFCLVTCKQKGKNMLPELSE